MALSLVYQIMIGRFLSESEFSRIQAMFSWQAVINGILSYLILIETQKIISLEFADRYDEIVKRTRNLSGISIALSTASMIAIVFSMFIKGGAYQLVTCYISYVALAFIMSLVSAIACGMRWFAVVSFQSILPHATKLITTGLFFLLGMRFTGATLALPLSVIILNLILLGQVNWTLNKNEMINLGPKLASHVSAAETPYCRRMLPLALGNFSLALTSNLDVILATTMLPFEKTASYIKLTVLAKFFMHLTASMGGIIFPAVTHSRLSKANMRSPLSNIIFATALIGIVFILVFNSIGGMLTNFVFGVDYIYDWKIITLGASYSVLAGLYAILFNYYAGLSLSWYQYLCAAILTTVLIIPREIKWGLNGIICLASAGVLICVLIGTLALNKSRKTNE